jgi:Flp pilus assembly protein TadD
MKNRAILTFGISALVLGGTMAGGLATFGGTAIAGDRTETQNAKKAAKEAKQARKAIAKREAALALIHAEKAVALDPNNGEHRALLGEAYLFSGRFLSASQALTDALSLDPGNGRAALNLALAQIATGDWTTARKTIDAHSADIGAADRGLAIALAGDPAAGVAVLGDASRAPGADAKTRQNFALALALSGQWQQAKAVASVDLSPADVDGRIMQWATFSRPTNAYDQVASLLGVTAVADQGQPVQLALRATSTQMAAVSQAVDPVDAYMPGAAPDTAAPVEAPMEVAVETLAPAPPEAAPAFEMATTSGVVFAPRQVVMQAVPANAAPTPTMVAIAPGRGAQRPASLGAGRYYVQIGAFRNVQAAKAAWNRVSLRAPVLAGHTPASMRVTTRAGTLYRVSAGGFARGDADGLCNQIRASGGVCFVRASAGDVIASWAKGPQLASR